MIRGRLARAHAQMAEVHRVLGWMHEHSWTGGVYVLVPTYMYLGPPSRYSWAYVDRVTANGTPYPIKGTIGGDGMPLGHPGQWSFHEVAGMRFLSTDFPELHDLHPEFPRPPAHDPWS